MRDRLAGRSQPTALSDRERAAVADGTVRTDRVSVDPALDDGLDAHAGRGAHDGDGAQAADRDD